MVWVWEHEPITGTTFSLCTYHLLVFYKSVVRVGWFGGLFSPFCGFLLFGVGSIVLWCNPRQSVHKAIPSPLSSVPSSWLQGLTVWFRLALLTAATLVQISIHSNSCGYIPSQALMWGFQSTNLGQGKPTNGDLWSSLAIYSKRVRFVHPFGLFTDTS